MVMEMLENNSDYAYDYDIDRDFTITERYNQSPSHDSMSTVQIIALLIYTITCVLGLLGNGLVIAIILFKMKKSVNAIWFLNLAAADFLFNVFLPLNVAYTAMNYHWVFGKNMCKISSLLLNLNMYTSVFLLTTISFDRCILVIFPVQSPKRRNPTVAWLICMFIWALGFLMSSPSLIFRDTKISGERITCFHNFSLSSSPHDATLGFERHRMVTLIRFLMGFIIPMTTITVCYVTIIFRLKRNHRLSKSKKPLRIIVAIITTFFLCWCPYHTFYLLETQHHLVPQAVLETGVPLVTAIAASNSCMNPILYVFMGQDFKKFKVTILSRLANALSEDTTYSTLSRRSFTKSHSVTEKETVLL